MIKINLLPVRQIRRRRETRRHVAIYGITVAFVGAVLIAWMFIVDGKINSMKKEVAKLQQKKASFQPLLNEIDKLKKDKQNLETKLGVIDSLKEGTQITVRVLDEVAARIPINRIWLKDFKYQTGRLSVKGIALDNATIANYMNSMNASDFFSNADLESSSQTIIAEKKLQSFSINFVVITPEVGQQMAKK